MEQDLLKRLKTIEERLDKISKELVELREKGPPRPPARKRKEKLPPPTEEEVSAGRRYFSDLFQRWMDGKEQEVQEELEGVDIEKLRRLADINNLNVTAKMSKQRILQLVAARFREKRQLLRPPIVRGNSS